MNIENKTLVKQMINGEYYMIKHKNNMAKIKIIKIIKTMTTNISASALYRGKT